MQKAVNALILGETDADKLLSLVHRRIRNKHGEEVIKSSLTGIVSLADRDILRMNVEEVKLYDRQLLECEDKMRMICQEYYRQEMEILQTVPGIKGESAMRIIAETGVAFEPQLRI